MSDSAALPADAASPATEAVAAAPATVETVADAPVASADAAADGAPAKGKPRTPKEKAPPKAKPINKMQPKEKAKDEKAIQSDKINDFSSWYTEVITKSEMIEYYAISGCYILRPWSFSIWEEIQRWFDARIKELDVENSYFPMFVTQRALNAEKAHVEGFSAEVAWITKSGQSELKEPIAIRPTSETIMYPAFATWIRSHRDLPLKLNQWCSVVRWEFKQPCPFIRTREFLWQEGHTAHATEEEAAKMVLDILELYRRVYEEILAVPVIKGCKSKLERFAGGVNTTTIEGYIPANGRAIQAATSHNLGTNFAKMFHIEFEAEDGSKGKRLAVQTSWGLTTRSLGVMIMVHGDNKGLVLPPRAAPLQVVLVPIHFVGGDNDSITKKAQELATILKAAGIRCKCDDRTNHNPGWKYSYWELKGVPLRLEVGPKDIAKEQVFSARRDNGVKASIPFATLAEDVKALLDDIQQSMFLKARQTRDENVASAVTWDEFMKALNARKMVMTPWCEETACEEKAKKRSGEESKIVEVPVAESTTADGEVLSALTGAAKTLCIPFEQPALAEGTHCFACEALATKWCLWGRSY